MYATAQRVSSGRATGINAVMYRHDPAVALERLEPGQIVEQQPGQVVSAHITVPPGGNSVLSYLDVVAPEAIPRGKLVDHLLSVKGPALKGGWVRAEPIALRFEQLAGSASDPAREFDELRAQLAELLRAEPRLPWQGREGITIRSQVHGSDVLFELEPQSTARLQPTRGPAWRPPTISIEQVTLDDLRASGVDTWVEIAKVLTGASIVELLEHGPVRFRSPEGRALWSWPAEVGEGYCLSCHRQHTLVREQDGYRCSNCDAFQAGDGRFVSALT